MKAYRVLYHKFVDVVIVEFLGIKSGLLNIFLEYVPIHALLDYVPHTSLSPAIEQ